MLLRLHAGLFRDPVHLRTLFYEIVREFFRRVEYGGQSALHQVALRERRVGADPCDLVADPADDRRGSAFGRP